MTDIEKARQLFRDAGLAFPTIPEELAAKLNEFGPWLFSTRPIEISPYNLEDYLHEDEGTQVKNYVVLSHSGHGVNSYAIQYYLVQGPLHMFLQLGWGGVYMDADADAAKIRECFSAADQVVRAAQSEGSFQADGHLTVVGSDFYGSYWLPPGESRREETDRKGSLDAKPLQVLTEVLDWLATYRGGKRSERRTTVPIPRVQSLLLPVLRTVEGKSGRSVEEIRNRVKDEFKLTDKQTKQTHQNSGINVFVNRVAWALAHLVMGKAITQERIGYRMTGRGREILNGNPSELTIRELH